MSGQFSFSEIPLFNYKPVSAAENDIRGGNYVSWGANNKYPDYLYSLYKECSTLQSIVNGSIDYTMGNGITNNTPFLGENRFGDTMQDVIHKLTGDRWIFGGFCFQVLYNTFGQIIEICYLDFRKVRVNRDLTHAYVYTDWSGWGKNRAEKFKLYNPKTGANDGLQIYYYKGLKTRGIYPIPDYEAALLSIDTQIKIQSFHHNELINNFAGSTIINFNNGIPGEEVMKEIEEAVTRKFTGPKNAGSIFVTFNNHKDNAMTIEKLNGDNLDTRYKDVAESSRENIFISMRANPLIFGLNQNTGFNSQEFKDAFALYNKTAIVPKQREITRVFDRIFEASNSVEFESFNIEFENE